MTPPKWGGRRAAEWSAAVLTRYGRRCLLQLDGCTGTATTGDHIIPRAEDVTLQYLVTNGRPACQHCNSKRQAQPVDPVIVDPLGLLTPEVKL